MGDGTTLHLLANLSTAAIGKGPDDTTGHTIWGGEPGDLLPPWSVFWRLEAR
jgi:maltooligosyltrehalose trehalohydrolase